MYCLLCTRQMSTSSDNIRSANVYTNSISPLRAGSVQIAPYRVPVQRTVPSPTATGREPILLSDMNSGTIIDATETTTALYTIAITPNISPGDRWVVHLNSGGIEFTNLTDRTLRTFFFMYPNNGPIYLRDDIMSPEGVISEDFSTAIYDITITGVTATDAYAVGTISYIGTPV